MRIFRITLSHGSESVTFDGAGARSGSMFHVRRDAIEGLWSSPASKVSLTERETANGASPISDGETLYAARTVAIPFAIQSNYNHTNLIRARTLLGRLIGWHDVRMEIYDDGDETVLFGYVEAKYSDIPYDHTDTGVITVVCPDPRRVSKHASTVTMNTSSSNLGGLSFGTTAYELAWTGTPNASESRLLDGAGNIIATNLAVNPKPLASWPWEYGNACSVVQDGDWCKLVPDPGNGETDQGWQWFNKNIHIAVGDYYVVAWLRSDYPGTYRAAFFNNASSNQAVYFNPGHGGSLFVQKITVANDNGFTFQTMGQYPLWVRALGIYAAADWQAMREAGVTWFDGDSQSPEVNLGLAFPLDFGQTGDTGNTGMIVNNGSYVSTPIITAHGGLDGGLTVHWTTSDGNEGDLSYKGSIQNVPMTISTDTHSAIMGGLDVSYQLGSRDWPRIPAGGSCSFSLLASGSGWVTVQSHDTYM